MSQFLYGRRQPLIRHFPFHPQHFTMGRLFTKCDISDTFSEIYTFTFYRHFPFLIRHFPFHPQQHLTMHNVILDICKTNHFYFPRTPYLSHIDTFPFTLNISQCTVGSWLLKVMVEMSDRFSEIKIFPFTFH